MQSSALIDGNGRPVRLDRQLGSGAQGAVFSLPNDPSRVAKVYHKPPSSETVQKLKAMIALANPQLLGVTTWPCGLLLDARSRMPSGFIMPRLPSDYQEIWHLYHPVERLKCFPNRGWKFQIKAAYNLAAAFDEVHKAGCVVGDVQLRNVNVSSQALVLLVDCDSFQVPVNGKPFTCGVGLPHYIPPELQGKSLDGLVRTPNHDRFGLAVLIYQLLFVGKHPYMGLYRGNGDPSFQQLIAEFRFAQGPLARSWYMDPPPYTPIFSDIPSDLGLLFRRAFERGSETGTRPRADEWLRVIKGLEQNIVKCKLDPGHEYWQGAKTCVWCRLATNDGPEYYFGVAGAHFAVDEAKLQEVLGRLKACGPIEFPYDRNRLAPDYMPKGRPPETRLEKHESTAIGLGIGMGVCVLVFLFGGLVHRYLSFSGLLGAFACCISLSVHIWLSPWHREQRRRRMLRNQARSQLEEIETEWERNVLGYSQAQSQLADSIRSLIPDCRALASEYQVQLQHQTKNAEALARIRHLRLHFLTGAEIPNIGEGRKKTLAAHSIFTAADIEESRIRQIKGFGDVLISNLTDWKAKVLGEFRFNPTTAISPADLRPIASKFRTRQEEILAELDRQLGKLQTLAPACRTTLQKLVPELKAAVADYYQAEADVRLLDSK